MKTRDTTFGAMLLANTRHSVNIYFSYLKFNFMLSSKRQELTVV